jgi:hypothetical protein
MTSTAMNLCFQATGRKNTSERHSGPLDKIKDNPAFLKSLERDGAGQQDSAVGCVLRVTERRLINATWPIVSEHPIDEPRITFRETASYGRGYSLGVPVIGETNIR